MYLINLVSMAICAVIGFLLLVWIIPNHTPPYPGYGIPSTLFPNILASIILSFSLVNLLYVYVTKKGLDKKVIYNAAYFKSFFMFLLPLALCMPFMELIGKLDIGIGAGYLAGGSLFVAYMQYYMGERQPTKIILVSVLTTAVLYVVFWHGLGVILP